MEDRLEKDKVRSMLIQEHASSHTVSVAHARAVAPPSRPPSLEAGAAYEDIINEYRTSERNVAEASDELKGNLEQHQGMRES